LRGGNRRVEVDGRIVTTGGDVIVAIGGRPVSSKDDVARFLIRRYEAGESATFTIVRDGRRQRVRVKLEERPPRPDLGG
jgi:S1-C subfamily serine protease